jgi:hypothetical protein
MRAHNLERSSKPLSRVHDLAGVVNGSYRIDDSFMHRAKSTQIFSSRGSIHLKFEVNQGILTVQQRRLPKGECSTHTAWQMRTQRAYTYLFLHVSSDILSALFSEWLISNCEITWPTRIEHYQFLRIFIIIHQHGILFPIFPSCKA